MTTAKCTAQRSADVTSCFIHGHSFVGCGSGRAQRLVCTWQRNCEKSSSLDCFTSRPNQRCIPPNPAMGYGSAVKSHNGLLIGSSLCLSSPSPAVEAPIECVCSFCLIESRSHNPMSCRCSAEMPPRPLGLCALHSFPVWFCFHADDAQYSERRKHDAAHVPALSLLDAKLTRQSHCCVAQRSCRFGRILS